MSDSVQLHGQQPTRLLCPWDGLQARILKLVARSFSNACMHAKSLWSCLTLCDPIDGSPPGSSVPGFSRQEHWSGLPFPSPKRERTQTNKIRSEKGEATTDTREIQKIVRDYYKKLYAIKMHNVEEMD